MAMMDRERAILQEVIKSIIKDIKLIQEEIKEERFLNDRFNHLKGQETALINQKIKLERWRKSLKSN